MGPSLPRPKVNILIRGQEIDPDLIPSQEKRERLFTQRHGYGQGFCPRREKAVWNSRTPRLLGCWAAAKRLLKPQSGEYYSAGT